MTETVLVTGGAGFIGSHLVDALLASDHRVIVLDNLDPQVHGPLSEQGKWPAYCDPRAEYILADVRDRSVLDSLVSEIDVLFHLAANTGVGQSMYQIAEYFDVNVQGTANLLDALVGHSERIRRIILSSSRAVYGEGAYHCTTCGLVHPPVRQPDQLNAGLWEVSCPNCKDILKPVLTAETLPTDPGSMYAITKLTQEQMCLCFGKAYDIPVTALRFFNVYGPRQSLSNPYTGIITTFLRRLAAEYPPEVYEDGQMTRDFVHVSDVVRACIHAMNQQGTESGVFNVGTGSATSILSMATLMCHLIAPQTAPVITGQARVGDIRHCTADLSTTHSALGYAPHISLEAGLKDLIEATTDIPAQDLSSLARKELEQAGLMRSFTNNEQMRDMAADD